MSYSYMQYSTALSFKQLPSSLQPLFSLYKPFFRQLDNLAHPRYISVKNTLSKNGKIETEVTERTYFQQKPYFARALILSEA